MHTIPFRHPKATHVAGAILGWRRNGSPIYAIAGGSGEGEGASGGTPPVMPPAGSPPPATPPAVTPTPPAVPPAPPEDDVKSLPEWAQKAISDARAEAGKERTTAKANAAEQARQQLAQEIGKDDKPADPAELTKTITTQTSRIAELETAARTQAVELAVHGAAARLGANAAALLDSRAFLTSVQGLDPTGADFATLLDAAITAAVEQNQQLRGGQVPRRGGGDFAGGPGTTGRPASLGQAVAAALSGG
ncbi:hypothetical protein J7F03_20750 [Streptomyces sp. ISL-43]|uniref:hypothetical protein n=1 Tax=Streptomyces sp. ISL-43 TaxID=2819183 RepID=UPI001BE5F159|nr:hypothetical protein [Streptomyces sp. ISL-43]MBT2449473.1 hypothetical protein [Streptomyces sp. ISL-43]